MVSWIFVNFNKTKNIYALSHGRKHWICMKELQSWTLSLRRPKANERCVKFGGNLANIPSMSYIGTVRYYFQRVRVSPFLPGENCSLYISNLPVQTIYSKIILGDSLCLKWWGEKNGSFVFSETSFSDAIIKMRAS